MLTVEFVVDKKYIVTLTGEYQTELTDAMTFTDKIDAIIYVEKHGYERIATIRKVMPQKNSVKG